VQVFGLGADRLEHDGQGQCVHGEVQAGDGVVWLHQVSPGHHHRALAAGAEILYSPADMPYGFREYSAGDPEGGLWSFMKPLD